MKDMTINPATGYNTETERRYERRLYNYDGADEVLPFTFDDIPMWVTVYYRDRLWLVSDKSDQLSSVKGRHLELGALDREEPGREIIHESWINKWLHDRNRIHFNWWESK